MSFWPIKICVLTFPSSLLNSVVSDCPCPCAVSTSKVQTRPTWQVLMQRPAGTTWGHPKGQSQKLRSGSRDLLGGRCPTPLQQNRHALTVTAHSGSASSAIFAPSRHCEITWSSLQAKDKPGGLGGTCCQSVFGRVEYRGRLLNLLWLYASAAQLLATGIINHPSIPILDMSLQNIFLLLLKSVYKLSAETYRNII